MKCARRIGGMLLLGLICGLLAPLSGHAQTAPAPAARPAAAPQKTKPMLYHETDRPQFHFTAKQGWLNDPNGLVYFDGEYHLFFQWDSELFGEDARKIWGHAISRDLVHWTQVEDALTPDALGPIWSGSAVVDWNNTSGFGSPGKPPLIALYTAAGGKSPESQGHDFTQCLAYSADHGRTWTKYARNPVLPQVRGGNRDPKVIWDAPTHQWLMALFLDGDHFGLFTSPNLTSWSQIQTVTLPGSGECPDFFPMTLEGTQEQRWVFIAANNKYLIGTFNGTKFSPETPLLPGDAGNGFYAAQTFSDIPAQDGRHIQIAWMRGGVYPDMPFNQQMSFPCALTLRPTSDGPRLCRWPVREIAALYDKKTEGLARSITLQAGDDHAFSELTGDLWDIEAEFAPQAGATAFGLRLRGADIRYHVAEGMVSALGRQAPVAPEGSRITLRLLLDRTSLETFGNGGRVSLTSCWLPPPGDRGFSAYSEGGAVTLVSLTAHRLRSAWMPPRN